MRTRLLLGALACLGACLPAPATGAEPAALTPEQAAARIARLATPTHVHGDPLGPGVPDARMARAAPGPTPSGADPGFDDAWCGTQSSADDTAHQVTVAPRWKVVYANPAGIPNNFATAAPAIQHHLRQTAQLVMGASGGQRTLRFDLGTSCGPRSIDIASVRLPRPASAYGATNLAAEQDVTAALGPVAGTYDLLVFIDGPACPNEAGYATEPPDEQPGPGNAANLPSDASEPFVAVVFHCGGENYFESGSAAVWRRAPLHEMTHAMGAVHDNAPHTTRAGHCWVRYSIMCYDDGGPAIPAGAFSRPIDCDRSGTFEVYDCGGEDYFAMSPAAGSYLRANWNVADSVFLCVPALCYRGVGTPTVRLVTPPGPVSTGQPVTLTADAASGNGPITEYRWDVDAARPGFEAVTTVPTLGRTFTTAGTVGIQVQVRDAFGQHAVAAASVVVAPPPPVNQNAPSVFGTARVGSSLSALNGYWTGAAAFAYRWERCVAGLCTAVPGRSATTYGVSAADVGTQLRVVVTGSNARAAVSVPTAPTAVVPPSNTASFRIGSGTSYSRRTGRFTVAYAVRGARALRLRVRIAGRTRLDKRVSAAAGTHRVRIQLRGSARRSASRSRALKVGVRAALTTTAGQRRAITAGKTLRRR